MPDLDVWFPRKLAFLREPHRYKILYGGRAGIKSWTIARFLLHAGYERPLRIPCARETMQSIRERVHQLLEDQITRLGVQAFNEIQRAEIIGRNGTSFTFHGLRDQSVHNIKSLEGADLLLVEEAQNVSKKSWRTVIPTIRKPGSEIWVSFNPELETDDTYKRFVISPPAESRRSEDKLADNPALSEELRVEMEHLLATDSDEYEHVYEGTCRQAVEGAVYRYELVTADKEGSRLDLDGAFPVSWPQFLGEAPLCAGPKFARIINYVGRVAQLIRDLFSVKCSQTEALRLLLNSEPIASIPLKPGNSEGSLRRKMPSGTFLAIWGSVTELIVHWKIAIARRRAMNWDARAVNLVHKRGS